MQYSQTAPADALLPLCLKERLIFFLSGQSALPQRRLFMYVCPPDRFSSNKATAVSKGIFCRSKWHWLILSLTAVFIEMGCIHPSERQGLRQLINTTPIWTLWCLHHLPFQIFSTHGVTAVFTFNYTCPSRKQPAGLNTKVGSCPQMKNNLWKYPFYLNLWGVIRADPEQKINTRINDHEASLFNGGSNKFSTQH